ncbi:hypothetical protein NQ317_018456 [Molorchus minor]|uniref:Uncharacterized protein n=1 Tax=Molorchus minor TaxID=1323400 RepID=A0ABQ9J455_9CUCU|nr:hypothetical protein NQ317_018456 [Molorchus minor]
MERHQTRLVPVPPMLRFIPQKYPITPIRYLIYARNILKKANKCPLRKLFFDIRAEPTVTEG